VVIALVIAAGVVGHALGGNGSVTPQGGPGSSTTPAGNPPTTTSSTSTSSARGSSANGGPSTGSAAPGAGNSSGTTTTGTLPAAVHLADDAVNQGFIADLSTVATANQVSINARTFGTAFVTTCLGCGGQTGVEINLERQFTTFTARLGVTDTSASNKPMQIEVIGDGRILAQKTVAIGTSYDVELPVQNVLRLRILFDPPTNADGNLTGAVGDPTVTR